MINNKFNLRTKLLAGFAIPVVAIIVIAAVVYGSVNSLLKANAWVDHTHKVIAEGKTIMSSMVDMETGMRGFLVAGKEEFLEPYVAGQQVFTKTLTELKQTVSDNPKQVKRLEQIAQMKQKWISEAAEPQISLRQEVAKSEASVDRFNELSARTVGKEKFDGLRAALNEVDRGLLQQGDLQGRYLLQATLMDMINQETGQRGFLLSGQEASLEPYIEGQKEFKRHVAELGAHWDRAVYDTDSLRARLSEAVSLADDWIKEAAQPEIEARRDMNQVRATLDDVTALIETGAGKRNMDAIRGKIGEFINEESGLIKVRSQEAEDIASTTISLAIISALLSATLVGIVSFFIIRSVRQQVGGEPELMADISRRIADGDLTMVLNNTGKETGIYAAMRDMTERLRSMLASISEAAQSQTAAAEASDNHRSDPPKRPITAKFHRSSCCRHRPDASDCCRSGL
jgi:methyl-accepting chemotaxis protein